MRMMDESGVFSEVTLHNVVYHPHFKDNLLSVHRLWHDSRIGVRFEDRNHLKCMRTGRNFRFRFDGGYHIHVDLLACWIVNPSIAGLATVVRAGYRRWLVAAMVSRKYRQVSPMIPLRAIHALQVEVNASHFIREHHNILHILGSDFRVICVVPFQNQSEDVGMLCVLSIVLLTIYG